MKTYKICEFVDNRGVKDYRIRVHVTIRSIFGLFSYSYYKKTSLAHEYPFCIESFPDKEMAKRRIDELLLDSQPVKEKLIGCEDYP